MTALIAGAAASCSDDDRGRDGKLISVDREIVFYPEWFGGATAITKLGGGELVVAGTARSAWVFATDGQGSLLWKYQDPIDETNDVKALSQTAYRRLVPLPNGNVLLCGQRNFDRGYTNLILILDPKGHVVEQREEVPDIDMRTTTSNFEDCMPWEGGALLLGTVSNPSVNHQWALTVDSNGKKTGEGFFDLSNATSGDPSEPSVLYNLADMANGWRSWYIHRVTSQGKVVATREVKLSQVNPGTTTLRAMKPTTAAYLIGVPDGKKPIMYTLDNRLADVVPPREIYNIDTTQGMGYVRDDGSFALFGRTSTAAVAWVAPNGQLLASHLFDSRYQSYTIKDAVPVSANQFVAIRDGAAKDISDRGVLMDWVTFAQK